MNDITKNRIRRLLQKLGVRVMRSSSCRYTYDRENYPLAEQEASPVILDIGANIGQSVLWYRASFPTARIYAFEPIPSVYKSLVSNVGNLDNVTCIEKAVGRREERISIPHVDSDDIQTVQVLAGSSEPQQSDIEVEVTTIDRFVEEQAIESVDIIKTDTEGFDLDVLEGASTLLREKRVKYIIAEVTILETDSNHTSMFKLRDFLGQFGYTPHAFYDGHHESDGSIPYFNVLFVNGAQQGGRG